MLKKHTAKRGSLIVPKAMIFKNGRLTPKQKLRNLMHAMSRL
jgi:hypothetical protein